LTSQASQFRSSNVDCILNPGFKVSRSQSFKVSKSQNVETLKPFHFETWFYPANFAIMANSGM